MVMKSTPHQLTSRMFPTDIVTPVLQRPRIIHSVIDAPIVYAFDDLSSPSYSNEIIFIVERPDNGWNEYTGELLQVSCAIVPQGDITIEDAIIMYAICKLGATIN